MFHVKHEWAVLESIYSLIEHRGGAGGCLAAGWCHAVDAGGWMPVHTECESIRVPGLPVRRRDARVARIPWGRADSAHC